MSQSSRVEIIVEGQKRAWHGLEPVWFRRLEIIVEGEKPDHSQLWGRFWARNVTSRLPRESEEIELFITLGADQLELAEVLCVEHADKFDWNWAVLNLLSEEARAKYECAEQRAWDEYSSVMRRAWAEYKRIQQPAFDNYDRIWQLALDECVRTRELASDQYKRVAQPEWDEFKHIRQSALDEYGRVRQLAWDAFDRIQKSAWTEYKRARASAFYHAWVSPENQIDRAVV